MRIHTNENTMSNIFAAARMARVDLDVLESYKSKTHDAAFEVILSGESRRRQNTGKSSRERNFAATWDQWGVFLSFLFRIDPDMRCGDTKHPQYANAADFEEKTDNRFAGRDAVCNCGGIRETGAYGYDTNNTHAGSCPVFTAISYTERAGGITFWPEDAHGDHVFRSFPAGPNRWGQKCIRCSARKFL